MEFFLASASPRRIELLRNLRIAPTVTPCEVDETVEDGLSPEELVCRLSRKKGLAALTMLKEQNRLPAHYLLLSADTVVSIDHTIFGKPHSKEEAFEQLHRLSGNTHRVHTGLSLLSEEKEALACETTEVTFRTLDPDEIRRYIATGEPFDKAGSYGIQSLGSVLVESIRGDYFNVVGLPIGLLVRLLKENFHLSIFDLMQPSR